MGELVFADGDKVGFAEEDVCGLVDGVGQEEAGHGAAVGGVGFGFDGGVAAQFGVCDQGQEGQHELVEGGDGRVGEDGCFFGVNAHGDVVGDEGADAFGDGAYAVAVGDDLVVGDDEPGVDTGVVEADPVA